MIRTLPRCCLHGSSGFYVDIGAFHPTEDSVTKLFYDRGWRGINVDPVPEVVASFEHPFASFDRSGNSLYFSVTPAGAPAGSAALNLMQYNTATGGMRRVRESDPADKLIVDAPLDFTDVHGRPFFFSSNSAGRQLWTANP